MHRGLTRCAVSFGEMYLSPAMKWLVVKFYITESRRNRDVCLLLCGEAWMKLIVVQDTYQTPKTVYIWQHFQTARGKLKLQRATLQWKTGLTNRKLDWLIHFLGWESRSRSQSPSSCRFVLEDRRRLCSQGNHAHAAEYFWWTLSCLVIWSNTVLSV